VFFSFTDPAHIETYALSLHDALPIYRLGEGSRVTRGNQRPAEHVARAGRNNGDAGCHRFEKHETEWLFPRGHDEHVDLCEELRRSEEHTSDSSHQIISYAVFCLKKKI